MKQVTYFSKGLFLLITSLFFTHTVNAFIVIDGVNQSSGYDSPVVIDLEAGSNTFSFITDTNLFGPDLIQFTIEENQTLDMVNLLSFVSIDGNILRENQGFLGIIDATTYSPPASNSTPGNDDLLTGLLFGNISGNSDIGTNLLEDTKIAGTNLSLTELTAGEYIFWFNETAGTDIYSIDFHLSGPEDAVEPVPVPAAVYLMLAPLATVFSLRKHKQRA